MGFPLCRHLAILISNSVVHVVCSFIADCLSMQHIAEISENLASQYTSETLQKVVKKLGFTDSDILEKRLFTSMESFIEHIIFEWHCRTPVNSLKSLAHILHSCGCFQEAIRLDASCKLK